MGATRRNLQAQPKIQKKLSEHQIYQSKRKFTQKKVCLVRWNLPQEPENNRTQVKFKKP
jgi:hypothetical protein